MVDSSRPAPGEDLWTAAPPKPGEFVLIGGLDEDLFRFLTQTESWSGSPIFTLEADGTGSSLGSSASDTFATELYQPLSDSVATGDGWSIAATSLVAVSQHALSLDSAAAASAELREHVDSWTPLPRFDTSFYGHLAAGVPIL